MLDPFNADGAAIIKFNQGLKEGRYTPEVFNDSPSNAFAGRDVTAIALQLPDAAFRSTRIGLWARISVCDHTPQRQVNRTGQAMFRPLFFNPPDSEAQLDTLNAAPPAADRDSYSERNATSPAPPPAWPGYPTRPGTRHGSSRRFFPTC